MIKRYRKLPVEIDAIKLTPENRDNEVKNFLGSDYLNENVYDFDTGEITGIKIKTLEGHITASMGDFVIRGVNGEHYPCKPDVFEKTYVEVIS